MNDQLAGVVMAIARRQWELATQLLYTIIHDVSGSAEHIINVRKHAEELYTTWHKSQQSGIASMQLPFPDINGSNPDGSIIIEFNRHGNGTDNPTVQFMLANDTPNAYRAKWLSKYNEGKITIPTSDAPKTHFLRAAAIISATGVAVALLLFFVPPMVHAWFFLITWLAWIFIPSYYIREISTFMVTWTIWIYLTSLIRSAVTRNVPEEIIFLIVVGALVTILGHIFLFAAAFDTSYESVSGSVKSISSPPQISMLPSNQICTSCGSENPSDAMFCINCRGNLAPASTGPTTIL